MKLYEIINVLQQIASAQPAVNSVYEGSVYQLNSEKDIKYGSIVITQQQHSQSRDFITYNFNIFYVDRLTEDRSNKVPVQSTALDVLANIILAMDEMGFDFTNVYYDTFTERFEAECAGAYATVSFQAPVELCADWYDIIISNIQAEGNGYSILDKYAEKTWVLEQISGGTGGGGISRAEAGQMIDESMDSETARTESTYLKQAILDGYAKEQWVEDKHYLTSADTQGFVTTADTQNFITSADTEDFATTAYTQSAISSAIEAETARTEATYAKNDALSGFVEENAFYDAIEQLTGFTESTYAKQSALSGLATETWVQEQGYLTGYTPNDAGNNYTPVYVSGGTVVPASLSYPGRRWGVPVVVNPDSGNTEVGMVLDFHNTPTGTGEYQNDYSGRIRKRDETEGFSLIYDTTGNETNVLETSVEHFAVDSRDVIHIRRISQSDYNDLVSGGTVNLFTLYLIP